MFEIRREELTDQQSMYGKYINLLNLVYEMQSSNDGISYEDIQKKFDVSRRTAERMIKAIIESNSDVEIIQKRPKRWRIKKAIAAPSPTAEHLAVLDTAAKMFKRQGMNEHHNSAVELSTTLKTNMEHGNLTRVDADLETLTSSEVFSYRPGPRQILERGVIERLHGAIKGFNEVSFDYTSASGNTKRWFHAHPYGFLHGNNTRSYLLALVDIPKFGGLVPFTLTNISSLEVYPDLIFERKPEHSVENYLKDCFGVFKEKQRYKVVWRFDAQYADVVREWIFHPSQTMSTLKDGRVEVKFKACGLREMAWHVITWGDIIEVVAPKKLIQTLRHFRGSIRLPEDKDQD